MILGKSSIKELINKKKLIINHDNNYVKNCSYKIRIGKLISPETGEIIDFQTNQTFCLEPSELILFQSIEKVKLPYNITASYSALYSVASEGILLINSSMIEPGYSGLLSGILLNFSSKKFIITKGSEIAKLNFYKTDTKIKASCLQERINDDEYQKSLIKKSINNYHKTFLNISRIEEKIEANISKNIKKSIRSGGITISILIIFATLEPLFSRWIWEKTGIPTKAEQVEIEKKLTEIKEWKEKNSELKKIQNQIDSLKEIIILQNEKK